MRLIVLGTGTEVGKTAVSCELARGLSAHGHPVLAVKPIETGFAPTDDGRPAIGSDAAQLEAAVFHVQHPRPHPLYALTPGISPHLAAERADQSIDLASIKSWLEGAERAATDQPALITLIETAGGACSPLSLTTRNYDLARVLQADRCLLVASDRLGILHDVAATLTALSAQACTVDVLVVAPPAVSDASTGSNAEQLQRLHPELTVIAAAPRTTGSHGPSELVRWVAAQPRR